MLSALESLVASQNDYIATLVRTVETNMPNPTRAASSADAGIASKVESIGAACQILLLRCPVWSKRASQREWPMSLKRNLLAALLAMGS